MTAQRLPGYAFLGWMRNDILRVGVLTGAYLCAVMVMAVLAANRIHFLEPFADIRNWAARGAFGLVMLVPIFYFRRSAPQMFFSAMLGWTILCLAYWAMGIPFEHLHMRLRPPLNVFLIGAVAYGVVAVVQWVGGLIYGVFMAHPAPARRR
jgi:hypothetical protein